MYKKYRDPTGVLKETVHYTYDALGRTLTATDGTGVTSYEYDADGRTTKVVSPQGTVHHRYDPTTGRLVETWTGPDKDPAIPAPATDTLYGYDALGRLASVSSAAAGAGTATAPHERYDATGRVAATAANNPLPTTLYTYEAVGNLDSVTLPNGVVTQYTYDPLNRLDVETVNKGDGTLLAKYDYHVRDDGLRDSVLETRRTNSAGAYSTVAITWGYDALGRLTSEARDEGNDGFGTDNQPDAGDFLTRYDYDLAGNRIHQKTDHAADGDHTVAGETDASFDDITTYDYVDSLLGYNADDRLYTTTEDSGGTETITTYAYDANGSTTSKSTSVDGGAATTVNYVYDARNRLVRLDANGDTEYDANDNPLPASSTDNVDTAPDDTTYAYDDDGDRVSQTTGGQTTTYVVDKQNPTGYSQVVEEHVGNAAVPAVSYVVGADVIGQVKQSANSAPDVQYLLYDGHGSTRELLAADGTPVLDAVSNKYVLMDYDAFGNQLGFDMAAAAANLTELLYSGEQYDSGIGRQYLRARYYDQAIGRFSSFDTYEGNSGSPESLAKYVYAYSNPISYTDPTGHFINGALLTEFLTSNMIRSGLVIMLLGGVAGVYLAATSAPVWKQAELAAVAREFHVQVTDNPPVEAGYRYFVHGTTTTAFYGQTDIELSLKYSRPDLDFGVGVYGYPYTLLNQKFAADLAHNKVAFMKSVGRPEGVPFLLVYRIREDTYKSLKTIDFNDPAYAAQYTSVVNSYRSFKDPFAGADVELMIGPIAVSNGTSWVKTSNPKHPDQYAFKSPRAVNALEPAAIIPLWH